MQISEFIEATSRIESYYGKEYTTEQRRIMYEELKTINIERYRQLISSIIRKSKYLPKVADFIEVDKEVPREKKEENKTTECNICGGEGYPIRFPDCIWVGSCRYDCALRACRPLPLQRAYWCPCQGYPQEDFCGPGKDAG